MLAAAFCISPQQEERQDGAGRRGGMSNVAFTFLLSDLLKPRHWNPNTRGEPGGEIADSITALCTWLCAPFLYQKGSAGGWVKAWRIGSQVTPFSLKQPVQSFHTWQIITENLLLNSESVGLENKITDLDSCRVPGNTEILSSIWYLY